MNLRQKLDYMSTRLTAFLGLDLKYFASGGFWTAFGQGVNALVSMFLVIAFANLLPKETYGLYKYILSLAGIFNIFTLTGMNTAVVQAVASGNEGALRTSVKYQLKWNLMMMAALWIAGFYYLWQNNPLFAYSFFVLGLFSPLTAAFNTYGGYLEGKKEFKLNNIFGAVSVIIYAAGILTAIWLTQKVAPLIIAYSITAFISNLIFYFKTLRLFHPPLAPAGDVLKYGKQLTFIGLISPVVAQADSIVLAHFWGPASLAVYVLARAIPDRVVSFIKYIVNLGLPKLAQKSEEDINKVFYKRIFQGILLGTILAGGYILLSPLVFKYLLPKYLESIFYSQLLSLMFIFAAPLGYMSAAFTSQKMVRPIFLTGLSSSIIKIILYVVLGIWGGILGLITAQLIYYVMVSFVNIALWRFRKTVLQN